MHAVIVNLTITDPEAAERALHEQLVPFVSQAPGFVAGYWTAEGKSALSMLIFDTEEAAGAVRQNAAERVPDGVILDGIEVSPVVAHA